MEHVPWAMDSDVAVPSKPYGALEAEGAGGEATAALTQGLSTTRVGDRTCRGHTVLGAENLEVRASAKPTCRSLWLLRFGEVPKCPKITFGCGKRVVSTVGYVN